MAIGMYDLDDDDLLESEVNEEPASLQEVQTKENEDDFLSDFLKSRGINDPSKIKFEEEDGSIVEKNWKDLSRQELMNIVNSSFDEESNNDLQDDEITLINKIRSSGMTPEEYLSSISGQQIEQTPFYKIDDLSDDELYLLDLESRVEDLTDDEAAAALTSAKLNETFYQKQVEGIRKEYKRREDFETEQEQARLEDEQRMAYENYQELVVNAINLFTSVGNLDLNFDDSDKNNLANFMLAQDENGVNPLYQALQDPQTLVKAAWFILNGDEAFDSIEEYFKHLIKLVSDNQYKRGFEDAKKGINPTRATVIIDNNKVNRSRQYKSIEDLDDED